MPTYTQLQAEAWWGREIVTPELRWLGDELCRRTGRPRDAFGDKGNNVHLRGAHRSQEWIQRSVFCTSRTYTVQSGLTAAQARHIAGVDFTPGSVEAMIAQSKRLMAAMKAGVLDGVFAIYCNVDGDHVVDGWDNVRNRAASSDKSHLWHWHLTLDRRCCADRQLMERIVAIALGDPWEAFMALSDQQQTDLWEWVALLVDPDAPATGRPGDRFRFPPPLRALAARLAAIEGALAASAQREQDMLTALNAVLTGGTSIDTAAVLARIDQRSSDVTGLLQQQADQIAELQAELEQTRRAQHAAALATTAATADEPTG
jgi:hypothetical protein